MEKTKLAPIVVEQKRLMVEYVQKYPNLAKQKFSQEFTFKKAQHHWEELSQILNSVPAGSKKTWMQWRKTWTDIKKNTKNKAAGVQKYSEGTGGGPAIPKEKNVTDLEKEILGIIGNVMQRGHGNITETPVEFNFVDLDAQLVRENIENMEFVVASSEDHSSNNNIYLNPVAGTSAARSTISNNVFTPNNNKIPDLNEHSYSIGSKKNSLASNEKGKRLSVTRRLETSQKTAAEMLKSMECRTSKTEEYQKKKIEYLKHMETYHEKKIQLLQNNNEVLKEILKEAKNIKTCLMGGENQAN